MFDAVKEWDLGRAVSVFLVRRIWINRGQRETCGSCYIGGSLMYLSSWYSHPHVLPFHTDSEIDHLTNFDQWNINKLNIKERLSKGLCIGICILMLSLGTMSHYLKRFSYSDRSCGWKEISSQILVFQLKSQTCE